MSSAYNKTRDAVDITLHTHPEFDIRQFQRAVISQNIQKQFSENIYRRKKIRRFFYLVMQEIFFLKQQTRIEVLEHINHT